MQVVQDRLQDRLARQSDEGTPTLTKSSSFGPAFDPTTMVDSRRTSSRAEELTGQSLSLNTMDSRNSSLSRLDSHSSTRNGSLSGAESRNSLLGSSDSNPLVQRHRSIKTLLGEPIFEDPEGMSQQASTQIPEDSVAAPEHQNSDMPDTNWLDAAFNDSRGSGITSQKGLELPETQPMHKSKWCQKTYSKPKRKFRLSDPFANLRCPKKQIHVKGQCKWDMFPGIKDPRSIVAVPLKVATNPAQLVAPFRRSSSSNSPNGSRKKMKNRYDLQFEDDDIAMPSGQGSPTGPLSVHSTSDMTSRSDNMEEMLTRTFDHPDPDSIEVDAEASNQSVNSMAEGSNGTHGSWQLKRDNSDANDARKEQGKTAPLPERPDNQRDYRRTTTAPEMSLASGYKETGRLRVERFKGITFVNEYALVKTLGRGSFGTVKLGLNTHDHNLYALKLLPKSRRNRRGLRDGSPQLAEADVMQEIDVMKTLDHPNIVRLFEVIDDPLNSKMLMVLEYVEGGTLFNGTKIATKKRFSELAARKYFRDVLKGLDYLHAHRIAHGDLKPDNLLLAANGHIKIADFGSSQLTRRGEIVSRTAGTPAFMAPEMCTGEPYHARLADLWALGVTLYMSVFGTVPFKADSIMGLYHEICNAELEFPDDIFVSDSLKYLLVRLLDKDPESRISLVGAMNHPWVTHNGAYPLPNVQNLPSDEDDNTAAYLMECWPDDPADIGLESVIATVGPLFEQRLYPAGTYLAKQGDPAKCVFHIEEGTASVFHTKKQADYADSDAEEDEDEGSEVDNETHDKRKRLKRQGSMLKTMFCATVRASRLVTAVRDYAGGTSTCIAKRGSGSFVGELSVYERGHEATWQTCVHADTPVKVIVLNYKDLKELIAKRPEVEPDVRAVMAQRRGELMKMEMLEKLAAMHRELKMEVEMATVANGASPSAIETARELLGCKSGLQNRDSIDIPKQAASKTKVEECNGDGPCEQPSCPDADQIHAAKLISNAQSSNEQDRDAERVLEELQEKKSNGSTKSVERSRESFESKGDSAKSLVSRQSCSTAKIDPENSITMNESSLKTLPSPFST